MSSALNERRDKSFKQRYIDSLVSAFPRALLSMLMPRKFILYGHLIGDDYHVARERYRYPTFGELEETIVFLRESGYAFVTFDEFFAIQDKKVVLLTFDDGFKVIATTVHPFLKRLRVPYAIFAMTAPLMEADFNIDVLKAFSSGRDLFLSETEILDLKDDGVFIGYHTDTHFRIDDKVSPLDSEFLHEITISSEYEHIFSYPRAFAYPFKAPDIYSEHDEILLNSGYRYIFDTKGFKNTVGDHYFRSSIDVAVEDRHKNCILYNLKLECLRYLKHKLSGS